MRNHGRPSKLTEETKSKLFAAISNGHSYETACALSGISERTFYFWKKKAENQNEKGEFFQFIQELKSTEAIAKVKLLNDIQKDPSWQSKAWILERRWSREWGKKQLADLLNEKLKDIDFNRLTDTQLNRIQSGEDVLDVLLEDLKAR